MGKFWSRQIYSGHRRALCPGTSKRTGISRNKWARRWLNGRRVSSARTANEAMKKFSHLDARGEAKMVDVSAKPALRRQAVARGEIRLQAGTIGAIEKDRVAKGNVFATARIAGIMAAKKTGAL